ncbi:alpha-amylase family glycosyl hydrolase [Salisediminibacterium selenitireducens]|uniref:Alpha-amylase n=1 Tax=Bacillus selenitireducens (strain ATCC 700615 / DSM 15326 / MLS10) TaxID=439292 RepID=D6XUA8_BACIE|nr:alpha-amylase family glycosyl hydrolase [Salisediminibacterium selenitireducens]ADH99394.1 alpha amylase catalytic region [[Bacillus] selenitireducens MLS10]
MKYIIGTTVLTASMLLTACNDEPEQVYTAADFPKEDPQLIEHFPETVFYEIFIRAFYDSTGDGIGDINGMTSQLDYLEELGVEGIWLMPFHPSPTYHGYDVTDYYAINPDYGTLDDFRTFIDEANERGIKVLMDFVVNHSSREHPWFEEAISNPDSDYRDWYIWADEETNIRERGEWGQRMWHGTEPNMYMSVFWEGMPDLNMDHPDVREEIYAIGEFWLDDVGVDGFRLDAAKHIYPGEEEKNHEFWREFTAEMEAVNEDVFILGEVWAPAQVTGPYLDGGLHSTFNFDLAEDLIQAARREGNSRLVSSYLNTLERFDQFSDSYIESTFLTNHDIDRVMSQLSGNEDRMRMAASLLLSFPGSPFVYYGEEIGMEGTKPDEHIREPMLWYDDSSAGGQTSWIEPRHNQDAEELSVESMRDDPESLWSHYQTWIHLRRSVPALLYGELVEAETTHDGVITLIRETDEDRILVLHNMSSETVDIDIDPEDDVDALLYMDKDDTDWSSQILTLPPYSSAILH